MKIKLFIILIILFPFICKSQEKSFERFIRWQTPRTISNYKNIEDKTIDKKDFLFFENASFTNENPYIPYYFELLKVNSTHVRISVSHIKTLSLNSEELKILSNNIKIPEKPEYSYNIQYQRGKPYILFNFLPLIKNSVSNQVEKVISFRINIVDDQKLKTIKQHYGTLFQSESVLQNGKWVKVKISQDGIYKLSYSELIGMGFSNPENIKVYGNSAGMLPITNTDLCQDDLIQNAIYMEKGSDGIFNSDDYILFLGKSPHQWQYDADENFYSLNRHLFSDYNYYFLTTDAGIVNYISNSGFLPGAVVENVTSFTDLKHHESDLFNLIKSGQLWLGENFDITTNYEFSFNFPGLIKTSPVKIKSGIAARSGVNSAFTFNSSSTTIFNQEIAAVNLSSYTSIYANIANPSGSFTSPSDQVKINISYNKPSASSEGWLDYLTLNAQRQLSMSENQLVFRYYNSDLVSKIIELTLQNATSETKIWNITSVNQPVNLAVSALQTNNSITCKVAVQPGINEFIAFNNSGYLTPVQAGEVENQNLHALNHRDMIIVSHPDFISQANQLAELHAANENLSVAVVTTEQVYNEFSSGTPDATSIRNFARMIYSRPSTSDTLKYLLLLGDGSFDNKSISAQNINYVPTYQSVNSLNPTTSFVTDDFFGLLDADDNVEATNSGLVDIGIGRFPVQSANEAQDIVNKIITYSDPANYGNWLNSICFIGDDEDNNLHMEDADRLATFVDTSYRHFYINKIYLDAFPQTSSAIDESYPEVNQLINDVVNNGILIFNYTGHGGESGLAHERVLTIDNINSWKNKNKLAIFMTATCEFSRFDDHNLISAGELVLLNPNGGAIALFSTTRLVYSSPNFVLNSKFYNYVFEKDYKGNYRAFGDIIRLAKNASGTGNNKRNFTLLGDPALKIPLPRLFIITDSINGNSVTEYTDTLKALQKVTISGRISDENNLFISNFNGIIYPLVLDKKKDISTLANDGGTPMTFSLQNNIIYKGKASINNGRFEYTFIVPKDISYSLGNGKISYFASGMNNFAKGYFNDFIIGGSSDSSPEDNIGPSVNLYMNDENFVSGGITNQNPKLYAVIIDSSGINTTGSGIGHDIAATLDNNTSNVIVLNNYYESDIDKYQKGRIEYLFSELEEGNHNLKLKIWDVYNNSTEEYLDFIVAETASLALKHVFNYPNPFTENTSFYFDHNRPNEDLDVLIQIFTISGKLVKTIHHILNSNAFRSDAIPWDGLDDFGDKIGRGVYIYMIKVRSADGKTAEKIEKLVILK